VNQVNQKKANKIGLIKLLLV